MGSKRKDVQLRVDYKKKKNGCIVTFVVYSRVINTVPEAILVW